MATDQQEESSIPTAEGWCADRNRDITNDSDGSNNDTGDIKIDSEGEENSKEMNEKLIEGDDDCHPGSVRNNAPNKNNGHINNNGHSDEYNEAQRYIDVALKEVNLGNYERALKLLSLAQSRFPNSQADELQKLIAKLKSHSKQKRTSSSSSSGVHRRKATMPNASTTTPPDYTQGQLDLVTKINSNCNSFYQVLNVSIDATESEIKRAYKKLALHLHPDKNRAPGAGEAFKMVSTATTVLTDERKRKEYDDAGGIGLQSKIGARSPNTYEDYNHSHPYSYETNFANDDVTAEELFNMFFGAYPTNRHRRRPFERSYPFTHTSSSTYEQYHQQSYQQPSLAFGLILVLILISILSSFFSSDPLYSLQPSTKYSIRRQTQQLSIPYYVKENFEMEYEGSVGRLENSVEEDFIYATKQNCFREKNYREAMMARARSFGNRLQYVQAQGLKMPSCDTLSKIGITRFALY